MHSTCPPYLFMKSWCKVLPKDVLWANSLDDKVCSNTRTICDIWSLTLFQKGHGRLEGTRGKGLYTVLWWFLPHSGSLSGSQGFLKIMAGMVRTELALQNTCHCPCSYMRDKMSLQFIVSFSMHWETFLCHSLQDQACKAWFLWRLQEDLIPLHFTVLLVGLRLLCMTNAAKF